MPRFLRVQLPHMRCSTQKKRDVVGHGVSPHPNHFDRTENDAVQGCCKELQPDIWSPNASLCWKGDVSQVRNSQCDDSSRSQELFPTFVLHDHLVVDEPSR